MTSTVDKFYKVERIVASRAQWRSEGGGGGGGGGGRGGHVPGRRGIRAPK